MRYCCRCGNALSVGAAFCHSCGAALKAFVPAADEAPVAAPAAEEAVTPVVEAVFEEHVVEEPVVEEPAAEAPVIEEPAAGESQPEPDPVAVGGQDQQIKQERDFLDQTHRLLRWEKKAWTIGGTVFLIMGIALAVILCLVGVIFSIVIDNPGPAILLIYAALVYGIVFIAVGIVNMKAAGKIPQYTDTLYKDFRAANKRCNSIGMIVFCYFFGSVPLVFFVINFVRMKCNKALIGRILARQGVQ